MARWQTLRTTQSDLAGSGFVRAVGKCRERAGRWGLAGPLGSVGRTGCRQGVSQRHLGVAATVRKAGL